MEGSARGSGRSWCAGWVENGSSIYRDRGACRERRQSMRRGGTKGGPKCNISLYLIGPARMPGRSCLRCPEGTDCSVPPDGSAEVECRGRSRYAGWLVWGLLTHLWPFLFRSGSWVMTQPPAGNLLLIPWISTVHNNGSLCVFFHVASATSFIITLK